MKPGTICEWIVNDSGNFVDGWWVYDTEPCGNPACWMVGDIPVCSEHYDLIHGIGNRV